MDNLPAKWALQKEGQPILDDIVLYQGITIPIGQSNALLETNLIGSRGPTAALNWIPTSCLAILSDVYKSQRLTSSLGFGKNISF